MLRPLRSVLGSLQLGRSAGRVLLRFSVWMLLLTIAGSFTVAGTTVWALQDWPAGKRLHDVGGPTLLFEAQNGEPLGRIGVLKLPDAEVFPENLVAAVLSIEDRRFYEHIGVDPVGIARALYRNIEAGGIVEGGSTITQQLIKIRYLGHERRYVRKLREAIMAIAYDLRYSKDDILAEYLNSVYVGEGAYGMPAGARLYFNKRLSELTLAEAAMLAGLIKAPSRYNPVNDIDLAQARAAEVIDAMHERGIISENAARQAKAHPATLDQPLDTARARSWFGAWASDEATGLAEIYTQTMRVRTTLDPKLQRLAEQVVNEMLAKHGPKLNVSQAALVAMRPDGAVVAMVGGRDYADSQFNRAGAAYRHPGSTFKLFVYLAALRSGYTPDDVIDAGPVSISGWRPQNYGGKTFGTVTLVDGFSRSINTAAVRLAMEVGLDKVVAAARDLGIDAPLEPYPSLALGATGISLVDLTGAFASIRAGRRVEPWGIAGLATDMASELRAVGGRLDGGLALGPERDAIERLLRRVVESGTGRRAALPGFAAGKTGTSQDHRDAWFIGFNKSLVTGIWVGNDDSSPMNGVVGGSLPATMWRRFMAEATKLIAQDQLAAQFGIEELELAEGVRAEASADDLLEASSANGCDIAACSQAHRSFRPSDCTVQPHDGPRRLCAKVSGDNDSATVGASSRRTESRRPETTGGARAEAAPARQSRRPLVELSPSAY